MVLVRARFGRSAAVVLSALLLQASAGAQQPPKDGKGGGVPPQVEQLWKQISWQRGPTRARVGTVGEIDVPAGFQFTGQEGTAHFMKLTGNLPNQGDLGLICPVSVNLTELGGPGAWFLVFTWDNIGYVKDDDRNNLDGDAILASIKVGQDKSNQMRRGQGLNGLTIHGWAKAPFYDPQTNLLTWATRIQADGDPFIDVNYNSRILGRGGVMSANMVIDEPSLEKNLDSYRNVLKGFSYVRASATASSARATAWPAMA